MHRSDRTHLTFGPKDNGAGTWSLDGSHVAISSDRKGGNNLYHKAVAGAGTEEVLLEDNSQRVPASWSPDSTFFTNSSVAQMVGTCLSCRCSEAENHLHFCKRNLPNIWDDSLPTVAGSLTHPTSPAGLRSMLLPFRARAESGRFQRTAAWMRGGAPTDETLLIATGAR